MMALTPGAGGVVAVHTLPCGERRRIAACADCERVMVIYTRGLCSGCSQRHERNGTLTEFGYTRADRLADYARLQPGLTARQAAERLGVSARTIERYKRDLAGRAS